MDGWKRKKVKHLGMVYSGSTPSTDQPEYWNGSIEWITPNDLSKNKDKYFQNSERKISSSGLKYSSAILLPAGSLVISSRAPIGYLTIPVSEFTTNQGCKSIIFNSDNDVEFQYYNFQFNVERLKQIGEGTTFSEISKKFLENFELDSPLHKNEQKAIAKILNCVDESISKTNNLIEKQQVVRIGLMQDLFTKGVDENGVIRSENSHKFVIKRDVKVPLEWDVDDFEKFCEKVSVGIATSSSDQFSDKGVLFLRNQNIKENEILLTDTIYINQTFADLNKSKYLKEGDIITVRTGYPGTSAVVPKSLEHTQTFTTLISRPKGKNINSTFMCLFLNSPYGKKQIKNLQGGGAQQNLNAKALSKLMFLKPSKSEQDRIVNILTSLDNEILKLKEEVLKLKSLKTGLMQDLLTGKVKVPESILNPVN